LLSRRSDLDGAFIGRRPLELAQVLPQTLDAEHGPMLRFECARVPREKFVHRGTKEQQASLQSRRLSFSAKPIAKPAITQRVVNHDRDTQRTGLAQTLELNAKRLSPDGLPQTFAAKRQPSLGVDRIGGNGDRVEQTIERCREG
jgi:hypothetical protein